MRNIASTHLRRFSDGKVAFRAIRLKASKFWSMTQNGLLVERTIAYRPLPAVEIFRDVLRPLIKDLVPSDIWAY